MKDYGAMVRALVSGPEQAGAFSQDTPGVNGTAGAWPIQEWQNMVKSDDPHTRMLGKVLLDNYFKKILGGR
jgi:hypothetical protein